MTITKHNYIHKIESFDNHNLPDTLKKGHSLVMKVTQNGTSWEVYETSDSIRKVIDMYFQKLGEYALSLPIHKLKEQLKVSKVKDEQHVIEPSKLPVEVAKPSGKMVEHLGEEIKFIKRYVGLHNKVKSPNAILSFIKALQRTIVQKLIRKTSPLANEIKMIQEKLVTTFNKMKSDESFAINEKDLSRLVAIAGGEQIYPSIAIIKRYIGMQGKVIEEKKAEAFVSMLKKSLQNKKASGDDPYADRVKAIYNAMTNRTSSTIKLSKAELNGLEGIVKACTCENMRDTNPLSNKSKNNNNKKTQESLSGVLTASQMANRKFDLLNFTSLWKTLLGRPAKNFTMMFHGEPNNGKTTFLLKFAQYLAEKFGNVLYVSSEEYASYTMTQKVNELLVPLPPRLHFSENLTDPRVADYDFVILDSVNDLGLRMESYKAMRQANPETSFILVLQHTKDGKFKGGKDWEHVVEIVGEVEEGVISITKSRYAPKTTVNFFEYLNSSTIVNNN